MPGALNHSPADVLRRVLIAGGYGSDPPATPWPIRAHVEVDKPDDVITVQDTAGRISGRTNPDSERQEHHGVQVRIRAARVSEGWTKARALAVGLDQLYQESVTIGAASYRLHNVTRTTDVIPLGEEPGTRRWLFTINALVSLRMN